jgi:signal transduction histidine kinase/ActR/RegA family two-component response regulator
MARELLRTLASDLRRKSAEIERIFDALSVGIAVADDAECRLVRMNLSLAQWLGVAPQLTIPVSDNPADMPFVLLRNGVVAPLSELPLQRAVRESGDVREDDLEVVRADGARIALSVTAAPLLDAQGRPRGAVAVAIDVTERRRGEREQRFLADASRVLSSSLEYQTSLLELAALAQPMFGDYCAVDVLREDAQFARVAFVVNDPQKGAIAEALMAFPPSLAVDSAAARAIRNGDPLVENNCGQETVERAAQTPRHRELLAGFSACAFMMAPLRARGRTLGLLTVGTFDRTRKYGDRDVALVADVAARAGLAIDNALLYQHAQEANRLKEDFLATLSHELRTPLNALLGWSHMLKSAALDDATRRRALESVERNAHAQAVLINDLLDVSRVMSGKLRLDERPVDLQAVVLAAVDALRPAARAREIDLGVSLAPLSGEVIGDPDRLQQVVWNLLTNAVKFTPPRGRVELAVEPCGGAVQIVVSDNGAGIDRAFLPYVFERFRQGDSSTTRSHGGLGLGLAIVRHLVDLHGGTVTVESEGAGRGSRFTVTLPLRPAPASPAAERAAQQAPSGVLRGVRVLAIDDDQDSRELVLLILNGAGADVLVASSAANALDALDTFSPHVVITDIAMPDMDGYELKAEIVARAGSSAPPIVALTAYAGPDDARRSLEAGFALHMGKPADYDRLVRAIADLSAAGSRSSAV